MPSKPLQEPDVKTRYLLSVLLFVPLAVNAAALEQFRTFVAATKSARGEFSQRMVKEEGGKLHTSAPSSGNFLFARPGKFIWSYQKPYEQVLQADGEKLYIYDKDLNQITIKTLGNAIGSSPAAILFSSLPSTGLGQAFDTAR